MTKSPRPSVFAAAPQAEAAPVPPADAGVVVQTKAPAKGEADLFRTSLYLPKVVHDKLQEIAFHEGRKKLNDLIVEGVDAVLAKRGYATTAEMKNSAKAS